MLLPASAPHLQIRKWIDDQKGKGFRPTDFAATLETEVWALFQVQLRRMNLVDFADMLQQTVRLLEEQAAHYQPGSLLSRLRGRYTQVLCDEFQDCNM